MRGPSTDDRWWSGASLQSLAIPADLAATVVTVGMATGALLSPAAQWPVVRLLVGLPLLFFLPGYALVSALFPHRLGDTAVESLNTDGTGRRLLSTDRRIGWRGRLVLAFGLSVALQPLVAVGLSLLATEYTLLSISIALGGVTVLFVTVAIVRRHSVPSHRRFCVPYRSLGRELIGRLYRRPARGDAALNVALTVVVLVSLVGVGYAMTVPNNAERFTSTTLLTESSQGELVANDYPESLDASGNEFVIRLENNEREQTTYTVVGQLQRVDRSSNQVFRRQTVLRTSTTLNAGGSWTRSHTVAPGIAGEDLRLIYYVYRGEAPATPTVDSSYRYVHVWVDVPTRQPGS
ncbi:MULTISPECIES: DUF1616 domain-containing protein [Haloarcula]|uniref:DUF1616 domain-containing protein n=1 Tax=Haloarcula TaxID=2237 RepID=UPI0023E771F4|nr:DUF1616 domain-containing protein [Halomicroarcula sp. SHR3]